MESILESIKKLLGLDDNYDVFDPDIIMYTNSVLNELAMKNIGKPGFNITGRSSTWTDFLGEENVALCSMVQPYVAIKVQMMFDPPASSAVAQAKNDIAAKYEWLLYVQCNDYGGNK